MPAYVKPVPEGYHSITPYLMVRGASGAIEFYKNVFGAEELSRMDAPGGMVGHAELKIGDSRIMLSDEFPEMGGKSPESTSGSPVMLHFYTEDVDRIIEKAINAGASLKRPVEDQFYGDRAGSITDPYGHEWYIATHIEDIPDDEVRRRAREIM